MQRTASAVQHCQAAGLGARDCRSEHLTTLPLMSAPDPLEALNKLWRTYLEGPEASVPGAWLAMVRAAPLAVQQTYDLVSLIAQLKVIDPALKRDFLRILLVTVDLALATVVSPASLVPGASLFSIEYDASAPLRLYTAAQPCIACPCDKPACPRRYIATLIYKSCGMLEAGGRLHVLRVPEQAGSSASGSAPPTTNAQQLSILRAMLWDCLQPAVPVAAEAAAAGQPAASAAAAAAAAAAAQGCLVEALRPAPGNAAQLALLEFLAGEDKCLALQCWKVRNRVAASIRKFPGVPGSLQTLMEAAGKARDVRFLLASLGYTEVNEPEPAFVLEASPCEPLLLLVTARLAAMLHPAAPPAAPAPGTLQQRILALVREAVDAEDLEVHHAVATCAAGPYVTQPVNGPCALIAVFNYLTLTGALPIYQAAGTGERVVHGRPHPPLYLPYSAILQQVVGQLIQTCNLRLSNNSMLTGSGQLSMSVGVAAEAEILASTLRAGQLIASSAKLPRARVRCTACTKWRFVGAARAVALEESGVEGREAWVCGDCPAPQERAALPEEEGEAWAGAEVFPCLDGSMEEGPVTELMALLRIPFLHGFVPEAGSVPQRLIGHMAANKAGNYTLSLDPEREEHRKDLRMRFPHAPPAALTRAAMAECQDFLKTMFPMLAGLPGAGPVCTAAGLEKMQSRFHSEGGFAIQYSQNQLSAAHHYGLQLPAACLPHATATHSHCAPLLLFLSLSLSLAQLLRHALHPGWPLLPAAHAASPGAVPLQVALPAAGRWAQGGGGHVRR